jgi:hypothetical protein
MARTKKNQLEKIKKQKHLLLKSKLAKRLSMVEYKHCALLSLLQNSLEMEHYTLSRKIAEWQSLMMKYSALAKEDQEVHDTFEKEYRMCDPELLSEEETVSEDEELLSLKNLGSTLEMTEALTENMH